MDDYFGLEYEEELDGYISFYDNEIYHEEDIMDFLNILSSYITEGEIEYSSEEEDWHWKFVFNKDTKEWDEIEGKVYYSLDGFSDEVLIEELKNRGYTVSK